MKLDFKGKIAVAACKLIRAIGKPLGKGSSLPGVIALKIDKDVLKKIALPEKIIAVTGSNGKTSTVEMIASALTANGLDVVYNSEGANQLDGAATLILCKSKKGVLKGDVLLFESDEQSARHVFKYFTPTLYVITNLYRDQLSRNGHPERIFSIIKESIKDGSKLLLNADDPLVASFGYKREGTVYFGVARRKDSIEKCDSVYDDGAFCPVCGGRMEYDYRLYNHVGGFKCLSCDFKREKPKYEVTETENGGLAINGKEIDFKYLGLHHVHNMLAAYTVLAELGLENETTVEALAAHVMRNGRTVNFKIGENYGTLLVSKHENSISYDCAIRTAVTCGKPVTVLIIVDSVSRKYFTSDISWIYDIDFEKLAVPNITEIILAGAYCHDLAVRFSFTDVDKDRITVSERIEDAAEELKYGDKGRIFVMTCFSDKHKFTKFCELLEPGVEIPETESGKDE